MTAASRTDLRIAAAFCAFRRHRPSDVLMPAVVAMFRRGTTLGLQSGERRLYLILWLARLDGVAKVELPSAAIAR